MRPSALRGGLSATYDFDYAGVMDVERWQPVQRVIDRFHSLLAPHVPLRGIVTACDETWTDEDYKRLRPKGFPGRLRGVYLIYDQASQLSYVGLAMFNFDKRVWSHDSLVCRHWVDIIPFEDEFICLAPALEFLLISSLRPPNNKSYRDYGDP